MIITEMCSAKDSYKTPKKTLIPGQHYRNGTLNTVPHKLSMRGMKSTTNRDCMKETS